MFYVGQALYLQYVAFPPPLSHLYRTVNRLNEQQLGKFYISAMSTGLLLPSMLRLRCEECTELTIFLCVN